MSLPPLPAGLKLDSSSRDDTPAPPRRRRDKPRETVRLRAGETVRLDPPTGDAHDGDTFRLRTGENARLFGVDAFELDQTGLARDGSTVPLGAEARRRLLAFAQPDATVTGTGDKTYDRPVATLDRNGDAATALLDAGLGIATPEYLRGNDDARTRYMEAERLARLNRRGAWQTQFEQPSSYRHGTPDPWARRNTAAHRSQAAALCSGTSRRRCRACVQKSSAAMSQSGRIGSRSQKTCSPMRRRTASPSIRNRPAVVMPSATRVRAPAVRLDMP